MTWDEAIKSLIILDGSIAQREKVQVESGQLLGNANPVEVAAPTVES